MRTKGSYLPYVLILIVPLFTSTADKNRPLKQVFSRSRHIHALCVHEYNCSCFKTLICSVNITALCWANSV